MSADDALEEGVRAIRTACAWSERPDLARVRLTGDDAGALADRVCPVELFLRDGQCKHTLLLSEREAHPLADLYVGNDDGSFLLLADGITGSALVGLLRERARPDEDCAIEDLSESHTTLSLDGPFAWEVMAALEGPEAIGIPYLTFFHPAPDRIYLRAGRTGEYGYDLIVPRAEADALRDAVTARGARFEIRRVDAEALAHCALENGFFNIHREGREGLTPVELQLQWRVSYAKDFVGSEALRAHAKEGVRRRVAHLVTGALLARGDALYCDDAVIGRVLHAQRSATVGRHIALALVDMPYAHAGIDRYHALHDGARVAVRTVSAPFVNNRSLFVNPQRHGWVDRDTIPFPPPARRGV